LKFKFYPYENKLIVVGIDCVGVRVFGSFVKLACLVAMVGGWWCCAVVVGGAILVSLNVFMFVVSVPDCVI